MGASGKMLRVQDVGQKLESVHDPRTGPREVGGRVNRDDLARPEPGELVVVHLGLPIRQVGVIAAWHHDHHVRLGQAHLVPGPLLRMLTRRAEDILASGVLDQLRRPMAGRKRRVKPFEGGDPRPRRPAGRDPHTVDAPGGRPHEIDRRVFGAGDPGQTGGVAQNLPDRLRIERDHSRPALKLLGHGPDVLVGHRTHGA